MRLKAVEYQTEKKFPKANKGKQHKVHIKESSKKVKSLKETSTNDRKDLNRVMKKARPITSNSESAQDETQKKVIQRWKTGGLCLLLMIAC